MAKSAESASIARGADGAYKVSGPLVFATVRDLLKSSNAAFADPGDIVVDLSGVERVDSAGLALLIEWFGAAHRGKRAIRFTAVPQSLLALARISEIDEVLPLA